MKALARRPVELLGHRPGAKETGAEIEREVIRHHADKALMSRLVKTKLCFELFDEAGINTPCAARIVADLNIGATHVQASAGHGIGAFKACQHLINRPTRRRLNNDEIE